ncbi:DUF1904 domain-containing protein [Clostridium peptidivorans]|uniref:DUF1904 domain-containing protein n=1 Tax=Clostridium peptidivorans TaxID=100174 RepID=UPI000BE37307|nr:DUF1904 domain-containing protein [Clostridium peptidivorans]
MPQIKIRGLKESEICKISKDMVDELQRLLECPREYFTIELIPTTLIKDGQIVTPYVFVEVGWFDRGQQVQDMFAGIVTKHILETSCENVDIIFTAFKESSYYENGMHF